MYSGAALDQEIRQAVEQHVLMEPVKKDLLVSAILAQHPVENDKAAAGHNEHARELRQYRQMQLDLQAPVPTS